jgi:hypothetical protein
MSSEHEVLAALKALAEADRHREAPPNVEGAVLAAFRRRKGARIWPWAIAAGVAVAITAAGWTQLRHPQAPPAAVAKIAAPAPVESPAAAEARVDPVRHAPRPRKPREVMTPFFPLMEVAPPLDGAEVLRVSVPASTMRAVGLPVREDRLGDRIQADLLVSQEGLPAAIRFVKFE